MISLKQAVVSNELRRQPASLSESNNSPAYLTTTRPKPTVKIKVAEEEDNKLEEEEEVEKIELLASGRGKSKSKIIGDLKKLLTSKLAAYCESLTKLILKLSNKSLLIIIQVLSATFLLSKSSNFFLTKLTFLFG